MAVKSWNIVKEEHSQSGEPEGLQESSPGLPEFGEGYPGYGPRFEGANPLLCRSRRLPSSAGGKRCWIIVGIAHPQPFEGNVFDDEFVQAHIFLIVSPDYPTLH